MSPTARSLAALVTLAPLVAGAPAAAGQDEAVAPLATYTVTTRSRTLRGCPLKRVITTPEGWAHVVDGLEGAPPAPDLARSVAVLIVTDDTGGATSALGACRLRADGSLDVVVERREPVRVDPAGAPTLTCFFLVVPPFPGGVRLEHRTLLEEQGSGTITRPIPADPTDRDPMRLPTLGPDLRLTYAMADGSPPPEKVLLREETRYERRDLLGRVDTVDFPAAGANGPFPRFRDGARYVLAAYAPGLRSVRALALDKLPPDGPDGNPQPIRFRFLLEPVPAPGPGR
jgi:hypothetical protein